MRRQVRCLVGCMVALGLLLFLAGCSREGIQAFGDLIPLQKQLIAEYGRSSITFDVATKDSDTLGVTFVNSSFNSLTGDQQAEQAREIAEFVCQHYASMDRIDRVRVVLELRQEGFVADTTGSATFAFQKGELECSEP